MLRIAGKVKGLRRKPSTLWPLAGRVSSSRYAGKFKNLFLKKTNLPYLQVYPCLPPAGLAEKREMEIPYSKETIPWATIYKRKFLHAIH